MVAWQRARMQINPGRTNHLETFKNMQKKLELFKNINAQILIGAPPLKKSECMHKGYGTCWNRSDKSRDRRQQEGNGPMTTFDTVDHSSFNILQLLTEFQTLLVFFQLHQQILSLFCWLIFSLHCLNADVSEFLSRLTVLVTSSSLTALTTICVLYGSSLDLTAVLTDFCSNGTPLSPIAGNCASIHYEVYGQRLCGFYLSAQPGLCDSLH